MAFRRARFGRRRHESCRQEGEEESSFSAFSKLSARARSKPSRGNALPSLSSCQLLRGLRICQYIVQCSLNGVGGTCHLTLSTLRSGCMMRAWVCIRLAPRNDRQTRSTCRGRMPRDGPPFTSTPSHPGQRTVGGSTQPYNGPRVHEVHVLGYAFFRRVVQSHNTKSTFPSRAQQCPSGTSIAHVVQDLNLELPLAEMATTRMVGI
jgi:hypothetical protein